MLNFTFHSEELFKRAVWYHYQLFLDLLQTLYLFVALFAPSLALEAGKWVTIITMIHLVLVTMIHLVLVIMIHLVLEGRMWDILVF